jgi:multisubunit Na+/H+ antiporter MnhB subunit
MAKHPDIYTRNIVRTAVAIFVIYIITLFYSYKTVPLNWAIWLLFVLSFVFVSLIIMYFLKYHEVKKSNISYKK